jgi:hypothetical protein
MDSIFLPVSIYSECSALLEFPCDHTVAHFRTLSHTFAPSIKSVLQCAGLTCQEAHKFIGENLQERGQSNPEDESPTRAQIDLLRKKLGDRFVMPASKAAASTEISTILSSGGGAKDFKPASQGQLGFIYSLLMQANKSTGQV